MGAFAVKWVRRHFFFREGSQKIAFVSARGKPGSPAHAVRRNGMFTPFSQSARREATSKLVPTKRVCAATQRVFVHFVVFQLSQQSQR